jgi:hypothetical protein
MTNTKRLLRASLRYRNAQSHLAEVFEAWRKADSAAYLEWMNDRTGTVVPTPGLARALQESSAAMGELHDVALESISVADTIPAPSDEDHASSGATMTTQWEGCQS